MEGKPQNKKYGEAAGHSPLWLPGLFKAKYKKYRDEALKSWKLVFLKG